jgi:FlaA1/EpsC-like NDP-sugar epimerase
MSLPSIEWSRIRHTRWIRTLAWLIVDSLVWCGSVIAASEMRWEVGAIFEVTHLTLLIAGAAMIGHLLVAALVGAYHPRDARGSFDEAFTLGLAAVVVTAGIGIWALAVRRTLHVPLSMPLVAGLAAYSLMLAGRFVVRSIRQARALNTPDKTPLIVFGAGNAGRLLVHNLVNDPDAFYVPVALLDDDRSKRHVSFSRVRVRGTRDDIERVSNRTGAKHVVIAIPSAPGSTLAELRASVEEAGLTALVLPPLNVLVHGSVTGHDIRGIDLEDILGRKAIVLDQAAIGEQLNRRVVLVTGAGGSIGSELCRQIARFHPAELVLLDRDESALHAVSLDLVGHGLLDQRNLALADIRDLDALRAVFREHRPNVVFHAAALKHLPLLESYPEEAWKSNVLGTLNVLTAASEVCVSTFVNISTDKAAEPTSVLGTSKRIAERLTAGFAGRASGRYLSVRFGNVLGSRGSVIPAFQAQIKRGGPLTVTHPEVQRYFMLIPEACQLVMQAAAIGHRGEVMVLDMGKQVKILDLAKTLISLSGRKDIKIEFTGLRPGEKMSESLFATADESRPTVHPLLSAVDVPPLDGKTLRANIDARSAASWMLALANEEWPEAPNRPLMIVDAGSRIELSSARARSAVN